MTSAPPGPESDDIWAFLWKFAFPPWSSWSWQGKVIAIAAILTVVGPIVVAAGPRLAKRGASRP